MADLPTCKWCQQNYAIHFLGKPHPIPYHEYAVGTAQAKMIVCEDYEAQQDADYHDEHANG